MSAAPWDRNEGAFAVPSSRVPPRRGEALHATRAAGPGSGSTRIERQLDRAQSLGIRAIGTDTIVARIEAAMQACIDDGLGNPKAVYLIESDLMALREATGASPYTFCDLRVDVGAKSYVYAARGQRAVRRPARSRKRS